MNKVQDHAVIRLIMNLCTYYISRMNQEIPFLEVIIRFPRM